MSVKLVPSEGSERESVPCLSAASGGCWPLLAIFDLEMNHYGLYDCHHMLFSLYVSVSAHYILLRMPFVRFRAQCNPI